MAPSVPVPLLLISTSSAICTISVFIFPQVFEHVKLTFFFVLVTSVIFSLQGIWTAFIYPTFYSPLRHLPQPKGAIPLIGHPTLTFRRPSGDLFLKFIKEVPNDGLIRFPGPFNADWLLLTDPKSLAEVLVTKSYDFEKPSEIRNFLRLVLGDGLVIVEGEEHKFQRKHLLPAFSYRHIKDLYPIFWSKASILNGLVAAEMYENPEPSSDSSNPKRLQGVVEINHWVNKVTMDIIGVAGLSREFNALHNSNDELIENYEALLEPSVEKAIFFAVNLIMPRKLVQMLPWKMNEKLETTTQNLRRICRQLVRDKKALKDSEKDGQVDILKLLIKSNDFSDDQLVDQLLTFLAAGHETTSSAFTWGTHLLATHPAIQTRLREEIRTNLPSPSAALDGSIDLTSILDSLPYLAAVCNEVLRLFPPVPTTTRIATVDTSVVGVPIPKGTRLWLSPWAINRSPLLWGDSAGEFFPERWIDTDTGRANNTGGVSSNYSILTFLHGPRSCIGEKFAKNELKVLMAVFVGRFLMEMADPNEVITPAGAITTKPKNGMKLRLRVLEGW